MLIIMSVAHEGKRFFDKTQQTMLFLICLVSLKIYKLNRIISFLSILFLVSCQPQKSDIQQINVRSAFQSEAVTVSLYTFVKTVKYIPLETVEGGLLRGVNKVYMTDRFIWVSDYARLLQFDKAGKFIKRIGKSGNGPGELGRRIRFDISESANEIYIHSHRTFIYVFDLESGEYKRSFKVNNNVCRIAAVGDGRVATYNYDSKVLSKKDNNIYEVLIFNQQGECVDSVPDFTRLITEDQKSISLQKMLLGYPEVVKTNHTLYFKSLYQDTLWQLNSSGVKTPYMVFKTDNPYSARELQIDPNSTEMQLPEMLSVHKTLMLNNDLFLMVEKGCKNGRDRDIRHLICSENDGKATLIESIKDDIKGGIDFWPDAISDVKMVDWVEAMDVIEFYQQNKASQEMSEEFKTMAGQLTVDSNPVLVVAE